MASQAAAFVPKAIQTCKEIRQLMIDIQTKALILRADYVQGGGDAMPGLDAIDWANNYNITEQQFKDGMLDVSTPHNNVALSTIYTGAAYSKVAIVAAGE